MTPACFHAAASPYQMTMSTVTKVYNFSADAEGWSYDSDIGSPSVRLGWFVKSNTGHPDRSENRGSLGVTAQALELPQCWNRWMLEVPYTSFGVPAGKIVTGINMDYWYRWNMKKRGRHGSRPETDLNVAPITYGDSYFGPASINGTSVSNPVYCPDRNEDDWWGGYPQDPGWPYGDPLHPTLTERPIPSSGALPKSWGLAAGSALTGLSIASSATASLTIDAVTPPTILGTYQVNTAFVRMLITKVIVTVTYTDPPSTFNAMLLAGD